MPIIEPPQFADAIQSMIAEYGDEVVKANEEVIGKVAKEVTRDLKKAGSFGGTGAFRKAIGADIEQNRVSVSAKIGAKYPYHGLTHLLEFGHAKRNGGRVEGFGFVKPINDSVEERYMKAMKEALE